jgi:hypothetical protein
MIDAALSRRKHGFDSRWARQLNQDISAYFSSDSWIRADIVRKKHRVADGNAGEKKRLDPVRASRSPRTGFGRHSGPGGGGRDGPHAAVEQAMGRQACTNFRDALQASQRRARTHLEGQLRCRSLTDRMASNSVVASMTRCPQTNVSHGRRPHADAHGSAS